jgi:hypothetical protein
MEDADQLFRQARDGFLAALPADERQRFTQLGNTSADDVSSAITAMRAQFRDKKGATSVFTKIDKFTAKISPYFEVLGIMVSSHPEWTAIAWGALRLVLQVGTHVTKVF